jgi:hypothetical protein
MHACMAFPSRKPDHECANVVGPGARPLAELEQIDVRRRPRRCRSASRRASHGSRERPQRMVRVVGGRCESRSRYIRGRVAAGGNAALKRSRGEGGEGLARGGGGLGRGSHGGGSRSRGVLVCLCAPAAANRSEKVDRPPLPVFTGYWASKKSYSLSLSPFCVSLSPARPGNDRVHDCVAALV